MPLLAYFGVVGSLLLGLLFVAEAQLGPAKPSSVSTDFHGLPAPWKAPPEVRILTVREAPAPDTATVAQAPPAAERQQAAPPRKVAKAATERKAKKARSRTARHASSRNRYAHSAAARPPSFGFVW